MAEVILTTKGIRLSGFPTMQNILVIHFTMSGFTLRDTIPVLSREISVLYRIENSEVYNPDLAFFFKKLYPETDRIPFINVNGIYFPRVPQKHEESDVRRLIRYKPAIEIYPQI